MRVVNAWQDFAGPRFESPYDLGKISSHVAILSLTSFSGGNSSGQNLRRLPFFYGNFSADFEARRMRVVNAAHAAACGRAFGAFTVNTLLVYCSINHEYEVVTTAFTPLTSSSYVRNSIPFH
jgi:hypothetical protein